MPSNYPVKGEVAHAADVKQFTFLSTPLTSTSWDGDARSTTAKTLIDLSVVFGIPAGVKAILCTTAIRDSGSATTDAILILSPNNTTNVGFYTDCGGLSNDMWERESLIIPCDANGDIYYQVIASGALTLDAYLEIWGYLQGG